MLYRLRRIRLGEVWVECGSDLEHPCVLAIFATVKEALAHYAQIGWRAPDDPTVAMLEAEEPE